LLIGAKFGKQIQEYLFNPTTVSLSLIVGGILLIILENLNRNYRITLIDELDYKTVFFIGLIQCIAMVPGTSRSAATIIGAMLLGCSRVVAAEFSFFLAIPTLFAASVYSFIKVGFNLTKAEFILLAVGFFVSFLVALLVVAGFMKFISRHNFKIFGYYRIILGMIILVLFVLM